MHFMGLAGMPKDPDYALQFADFGINKGGAFMFGLTPFILVIVIKTIRSGKQANLRCGKVLVI